IGTAFSAMASMLLVHALATPSMLVGSNGIVQLAGAGNLPVGAAILALFAVPALRRPTNVRPLLVLHGVLLAAIAAIGAVGLLVPSSIPVLPGPGGPVALTVLLVGLSLFSLVTYRAGRTFLLTRRLTDLAVVVGLVWLGCALGGLLEFGYDELGFWIAHGLEVAGIFLIGVPAAFDLHRGAASYALAGDLSAARLVSEEEEVVGPHVRALPSRL